MAGKEISSLRWALVKYKNGKTEDVLVSNIRKEYLTKKGKTKKRDFIPQHEMDFEPTQWYNITSSQDLPDGCTDTFYGLIGKLADTQENLHAGSRVRWPHVTIDFTEPFTTDSQENFGDGNPVVLSARKDKKTKKANKRQTELEELNTFLANDEFSVTRQDTDEGETVADLKGRVKLLQEMLQEKEKEAVSSPDTTVNVNQLKNLFAEQFEKIKESVRQEVASLKRENDKTVAELKKEIEDMRNEISKFNDHNKIQDWVNNIPDDVQD